MPLTASLAKKLCGVTFREQIEKNKIFYHLSETLPAQFRKQDKHGEKGAVHAPPYSELAFADCNFMNNYEALFTTGVHSRNGRLLFQ